MRAFITMSLYKDTTSETPKTRMVVGGGRKLHWICAERRLSHYEGAASR